MDRLKGEKIAIVCREAAGLGGTTTTIVEHARRLASRGCAVDVYGWRLDSRRLKEAGANPVKVPGFSFGSTLKRKLFATLADRATAKGYGLVHGHGDNFRHDVLSLHNCVHAAHEAIHGAPVDDVRGVALIHARQLRERRFKKLIANSRLMKKDLVARFGIPEDMIVVIYPGYDSKRFRLSDREKFRGSTRKELGFTDDDVVFGLITSGDFKKRGVDEFLDALARAKSAKNLKAVVMGKESKVGPYLKKAAGLGLDGVVEFLPAAPDVARFYHALDVYVHPAHFEEFGQSVQEALACGLPVITTSRVGAAELIPEGGRPCVLDEVDAAALALQISKLATDAGARRRLAALGAPAVAKNTWDANFAATAAVYESLLK